jgi:superfamily II DNA or RNA helicase
MPALAKAAVQALPAFDDAAASALAREELYKVLFAVYGYDVLASAAIRRLLLASLMRSDLERLAQDLGITLPPKAYDATLKIASLQWRHGAKVVECVAALWDIPDEFLPTASDKDAASELLLPYNKLPALFDYQDDLAGKVCDFITSKKERACLLQLPTGAGKTRVAMEGIARFLSSRDESSRGTMVWMAHSEELCDQAAETFARVWTSVGDSEIRLTRFWGSHRPAPSEMRGAFVVAGYQKLVSWSERPDSTTGLDRFRAGLRLVIVDEAHKALAPTVKRFLSASASPDTQLLGLTATPGRNQDDEIANRRLASLFGNQLLRSEILGEDPIARLQERSILSKVSRKTLRSSYKLPARDSDDADGDITPRDLARLASDRQRNAMIVDEVAKQVSQLRPTIVFCCSVEHARALAALTAAAGILASYVDCRMSGRRRRRTIEAFRQGEVSALFNFGVLSAGFDAPNTQCVIVARPTSSIVLYSQMIGRGLRGSAIGGSENFVLVDVQDNLTRYGDVGRVYDFFREFWV